MAWQLLDLATQESETGGGHSGKDILEFNDAVGKR